MFSNLKYASFSDLKFSIDIPPYEKGLAKNYPANHLNFQYDVKESLALMTGQIGKYGTLAVNLGGSNGSLLRVAGNEGYVVLQTRTAVPMASGNSVLTASIVNAGEVCCPRLIVPAAPITLTISSQAVMPLPPQPVAPQNNIRIPAIVNPPVNSVKPTVAPTEQVAPAQEKPASNPAPFILLPPQDPNKQDTKPKIPYIVQGMVTIEAPTIISSDIVAAAGITFTTADYDRTYVGGLKKIADEAESAALAAASLMGAYLDSRTFMDATRSLQMSSAQSIKKYTTSDQVCRFGTFSKSLAGADSTARKNQLGFSKIMSDRSLQKMYGLYSTPGPGLKAMYEDFKKKYCSTNDNNGFLEGYCVPPTANSDKLYDRDVDFTRTFDVPLTLDADFTDPTAPPAAPALPTNDNQPVISLFSNLSRTPLVMGNSEGAFDPRDNADQTQDIRALNAMKSVSSNSFAALVGEKTKSTSKVTNYMIDALKQLGLDPPSATTNDAQKLLGANPSYFAQMEVLTKKMFQTPAFYANLYESEANVDRQRVAMKAIELQQDRDFLESLRRREMLLSVLLNAKLRQNASAANESGVMMQQK